ncbi:MAG: NAD(+)/NADH kinase [Chloroflexi bacterium]|nr:NAD(+)/NADH kinase [Chloroflexota bacterium]
MTLKFKNVGIIHHGRLEAAIAFALGLERFLRDMGARVWRAPAAPEAGIRDNAPGSDLALAVGGDGTLLRAARAVAPLGIPIVGINLGRLGFMTELTASDAFEKLPLLLSGNGWTDVRAMLNATVSGSPQSYQGLNDVVISRGSAPRLIRLEARINGELLTEYRADGIIAATATGSTGYSLAAGGPILNPQSKEILLLPVCPHLSFNRCLVLPESAVIELHISAEQQAVLSVDGQIDTPLQDGDIVTVRLGESTVSFLRLNPPAFFYSSLTRRLQGEPLH